MVTESMFTGMNPHAWSFAQGGLDIDDRIGAEQKEHARAFMQKNRVLPKQCYKEAEEMMAAGLAPPQPGYVRADLLPRRFSLPDLQLAVEEKLGPNQTPILPVHAADN